MSRGQIRLPPLRDDGETCFQIDMPAVNIQEIGSRE
jgi:hypothetical protein